MATITIAGVSHTVTGAQVAILSHGRVLVQFRPLPPGWELPGGHCGTNEAPEACAVREAEEETGLTIRIVGMVGLYRWAGLRDVWDVLYAAEAVGGTPRRSIEAWRHRYVGAGHLPRTLFPWFSQRIEDALRYVPGAPAVQRTQRIGPVHVLLFGLTWLRYPVDAINLRLSRRRRTGRRRGK